MASTDLFWTVFAAALSAMIMGGTFFWALIAYRRKEANGTQDSPSGNLIFMAVMMPLAFLGLAFFQIF